MTMTATNAGGMPATSVKDVARAAAGARDPRLDFFRGIAMFIILFAHTPGNWITLWIPARWGFSDATEIFVFCSGMASAIAFGRTFDRAGWVLGTARVGHRIWQVYWAHIALFFTIATMMAAINAYGGLDKNYIGSLNLWKFFADPGPQLIGLFTLTYVPNYFDILPMYLVILAMMPVVMLLARVTPWLAGAFCVSVWLLAQEGFLTLIGLGGLSQLLELPAEPWSDREWFFNPFGWQLIFFTGFAFMRGWIPAPPVTRALIALAAALVILNIPFSSIGSRELGFGEWRALARDNGWLIAKTDFGLLRYVHFLALGYLAWVLAGDRGHRLIATGQTRLSELWGQFVGVIMKVGQQSLAVFVFSMAFARLMGLAFDVLGRSYATQALVNGIGIAAIIAVAYGVAWVKSQPWRAKGRPA